MRFFVWAISLAARGTCCESEAGGLRRDGLRVETEAPGRPSWRSSHEYAGNRCAPRYERRLQGRCVRVGRVSSEWFSRPDDERFLSLSDLASAVRGRSERSRTRVVESALIHVEANRNDPERLALILPGADAPVTPTHWSFGQLASQVGAPAAYLRQLPAPFAANNLQYGLTSNRAEQIKTLETDDAISGRRIELRAVTGPDYGRIYDHELVEAVQKIAGNGTGDTRWKVPGVLDWSTGVYKPRVDITRDTTKALRPERTCFHARFFHSRWRTATALGGNVSESKFRNGETKSPRFARRLCLSNQTGNPALQKFTANGMARLAKPV